MHPDVGVCSIGCDELRAVLLLRQERGHQTRADRGFRSGRPGELHRGGGGLLLVTFAEVALRNAVLRRASSHDVCDLYIRIAPDRQGRSLPLWTRSTTPVRLPVPREGEDGDCPTQPAGP